MLDEIDKTILKLKSEGKSYNYIANEIGMSKTSVYNRMRKFRRAYESKNIDDILDEKKEEVDKMTEEVKDKKENEVIVENTIKNNRIKETQAHVDRIDDDEEEECECEECGRVVDCDAVICPYCSARFE